MAPKRTYLHAAIRLFGVTFVRVINGKGCKMSILKSRELARSGRQAEIEGNIRELVRQQGGAIRQPEAASEQATSELSNLLRQVSLQSTGEVDRLIDDLRRLRDKLEEQGNRVQRDIVEYAALSQSVVQLTKIVSDGMTHVRRVPDAPSITGGVLEPVGAAADETPMEG